MKLRYAVVVAAATLGLSGCSLDDNNTIPPAPAPQTATAICNAAGAWFYVPTNYTIYQLVPALNDAGYQGFCETGTQAAVNAQAGYIAIDDNRDATGIVGSFADAQTMCKAFEANRDYCTIVTAVFAGNG